MSASKTRPQIVDVADRLFCEQEHEATSVADIAKDVGLSRGNFYHHFKTKDEILNAVIERRIVTTRAMSDSWEQDAGSPEDRMCSFARTLIVNRTKIMAHGCPVGTLCNELARLDHAAKDDTARLFAVFRDWLARQFIALGREADEEALALHILMRSQGVAALATAFRDEVSTAE